MEIKLIKTLYSNNYLITENKEAVLIDCSLTSKQLFSELKNNKLCAIVLTHGHFDHFYTLNTLLKKYNIPVIMHKNALEKISNPKTNASLIFNECCEFKIDEKNLIFVKDKDCLNLLPHTIFTFYEAFGHTNDSLLIQVANNLFVGDFVFANSYGRTDLPTGNYEQFINSYKKHIFLLKNNNLFYGH